MILAKNKRPNDNYKNLYRKCNFIPESEKNSLDWSIKTEVT